MSFGFLLQSAPLLEVFVRGILRDREFSFAEQNSATARSFAHVLLQSFYKAHDVLVEDIGDDIVTKHPQALERYTETLATAAEEGLISGAVFGTSVVKPDDSSLLTVIEAASVASKKAVLPPPLKREVTITQTIANLRDSEELENLLREFFTDDVEEELAGEVSVSVGADGRATVTASSATKKKKKKKGKKKASVAAADSDEKEGAAGEGEAGAAEGTGELLGNPEFLTLDPDTELQFVVEEEEDAAEDEVADIAPGVPAVEPAPRTPVVRTNLQKVRDVAKSLFGVVQKRKTLRVRDFFQTMAHAFEMEGVDFKVVNKGGDRTIHSGAGVMKGFVPHGGDRKITTIVLKKATRRLEKSAEFVEKMETKKVQPKKSTRK